MPFLIAHTFVLLLIATALGLVAGWLIWGGNTRAEQSAVAATSTSGELEAARSELDARTGDVARLRRKLKRAVEELEIHATQLDEAEDRIAALTSSADGGAPQLVEDPELMAEVAALGEQLAFDRAAHHDVTSALADLRAEHEDVLHQLRAAEARSAELDEDLGAARAQLVGVEEGQGARAQLAVLEGELHEARTLIRDAAERVTYLERQALLWQNEADRLQGAIDENAAAEAQRLETSEREIQALLREHETALASLRMDASSSRLRADAAAEHLSRLQQEFRAVQERSFVHLETTRSAMADLDRQLAAAHSTLRDGVPTMVPEQSSAAPDSAGLLALPGMTAQLVDHLHELGVQSLIDVSRWSTDDVARIAAWLPEHPDVITANDWVVSAQALLSDGPIVSSTSGF